MAKKLSYSHPAHMIATCLGVGKTPFAPGTFGTIFGVVIIIAIALMPAAGIFPADALLPIFTIVTVFTYIKGYWATKIYLKYSKSDDPKEVVIDEVIGIFVAVLIAGFIFQKFLSQEYAGYDVYAPQALAVLFALFRVFDVKKPWPISAIERNNKGAFGVIIDDVVAGIFAAISFYILFFASISVGLI